MSCLSAVSPLALSLTLPQVRYGRVQDVCASWCYGSLGLAMHGASTYRTGSCLIIWFKVNRFLLFDYFIHVPARLSLPLSLSLHVLPPRPSFQGPSRSRGLSDSDLQVEGVFDAEETRCHETTRSRTRGRRGDRRGITSGITARQYFFKIARRGAVLLYVRVEWVQSGSV